VGLGESVSALTKKIKKVIHRKREILPQTPSVAAEASSSLSSLTLKQKWGVRKEKGNPHPWLLRGKACSEEIEA
jgi:hypothetical protein